MISAIGAAIRRGLWPTPNEVRAWYGLPQVGKPNPRYDYVPSANNGPACVPASAKPGPNYRAAIAAAGWRDEMHARNLAAMRRYGRRLIAHRLRDLWQRVSADQ